MKKKFTSHGVFSNLRLTILLVLLSSAISLALFATGTPVVLKPVSTGATQVKESSLTQARISQPRQPLDTVQEAWVARYEGPAHLLDRAWAIAVDDSGNVYVTGSSYGSGTLQDYATIKYNPSGQQQWVRRYNGPGNDDDEPAAIAVDGAGNVYVTGYSNGVAGISQYATIKYNAAGQQQWVARYGSDTSVATALAVDNEDNVYVTGESFGSGTGYDYGTVKYNSAGQQQWVRSYNGPANGDDHATGMSIADFLGLIVVTGYSSSGSGTGYDYATIAYDFSGQQQWVASYNGPGNGDDHPTGVDINFSGVYVTGWSLGPGTGYDYATIGYDFSGQQQWVARYNGGSGDDYATGIAAGFNGVYVTGQSLGSGTGADYITIKYDDQGQEQWVDRYNGPGNGTDSPSAIRFDWAAGDVYVTGSSQGSGTSSDYTTIKYDASGQDRWVSRYNGPNNGGDTSNAIAVGASGDVYVTGYSLTSGTNYDFATIKYVQSAPIPTPTPCGQYIITEATNLFVPGVTDTGNHTDDADTFVPLPFAFQLYSQTYNGVNVSSNGRLDFVCVNDPFGYQTSCLPAPANFCSYDFTIFPLWQDMRTDLNLGACVNFPGGTCGIFTSVSGTAPNRIFNIEWRTVLYPDELATQNFEVRLYENGPNRRFDVIYRTLNSANAIHNYVAGVQGDSNAGFFTQDFCTASPPRNVARAYILQPCASPTPTPTSSATPTSTPAITPTPTPRPHPTPRRTPTPHPHPTLPPRL